MGDFRVGLNDTPRSNRVHIAIFGRRNAGKSSLINALAGQDVALVSDVPGTTTDPVYKAMELREVGPVVFIDTPGIDDEGKLGSARVSRTLKAINRADIAVLVVDARAGFGDPEKKALEELGRRRVPVIGVLNKMDAVGGSRNDSLRALTDSLREFSEMLVTNVSPQGQYGDQSADQSGGQSGGQASEMTGKISGEIFRQSGFVNVSALTGQGIKELLVRLSSVIKERKLEEEPSIVGDLLRPGDLVFLVIPIDVEAPRGRLILPQVQTIRDILDHNGVAVMTKVSELREALVTAGRLPRLVITDSQVFHQVDSIVPPEIPLTSFSILFARYKGSLDDLIEGASSLENLRPGDTVLIAEACTHHPVEDDIGRVKIPRWLQKKVGGELEFAWCRGVDYPDDLERFKVIVHCGGCMLNRKEMLSRIYAAKEAGVPITNYGMTIAYANGILKRALAVFSR